MFRDQTSRRKGRYKLGAAIHKPHIAECGITEPQPGARTIDRSNEWFPKRQEIRG